MALNSKTASANRDLALDAALAPLNGGYLDIYDGTQPASPETAVGVQVKLAHLTLSNPAFGAASGGTATANAVGSASALASGTATWARLTKSDGTAVIDGSVGTSSCNVNMNSVVFSAGATISVASVVVTLPAS